MTSRLRIIFAGTPDFAVPCLRYLIDSEHELIAVYTQPDRKAGRGQRLTASPVKQLAQTYRLPIEQPYTLKDHDVQEKMRILQPDIMVVVAYGLILPPQVLQIPTLGCINVHASILPRWRGAAPIQNAILANDKTTGISILQMDQGVDTGPVLKIASCEITKEDTSISLHQKLSQLGAQTLKSALADITAGIAKPLSQDNSQATYAEKLSKGQARVVWQSSAEKIVRQVRAFQLWPVAFTFLQTVRLRIYKATAMRGDTSADPGTIISTDRSGICVATGQGILRLEQLQLPGGKPLMVTDLLNAKPDHFKPGMRFE